ncbi:unnamed protein product [Boreogadus saida]
MGDAMVGQALQLHPKIKWFAIRNASDPQMPNPDGDFKSTEAAAGKIYAKPSLHTTPVSDYTTATRQPDRDV